MSLLCFKQTLLIFAKRTRYMLENTFYTLQTFGFENNKVSCHIFLNKEHDIFKGHFPDNPVTPGVCMLQIIKEMTEKATQQKLFMHQCSNVKFMALINPETHPELVLDIAITESEDHGYKVKSTAMFQDTIALKLNCQFKTV